MKGLGSFRISASQSLFVEYMTTQLLKKALIDRIPASIVNSDKTINNNANDYFNAPVNSF